MSAAAAPPAAAPAGDAGEPFAADEGALLATLASRTLAGGAWALLTIACNLGLGMARTLVVARLVGARELGVMGMGLLTLGAVDALTATGVETALVSQRGDIEEDLDAAFVLQAARGALVAALLWAAAPLAAAFFGTPQAVPVVRALSLTALLKGLSNPAVLVLVKRIEFRRLFWWSLPEVLVGFAVAVGLALVRRDVWALVAGAVAAQAAATLSSYAMLPRRPRFRAARGAVRRLLGFGRWVSGARALAWVSLSADNAVVGRLLGASALGVYQLAFRVGEMGVVTFTRAVVQVALPAFTALQGSAQLGRGYRALFRLVLAANGAFALAVLLFARPLLEGLLGPAWLPAVPVLRILVVAMVFRAIAVIAFELFHAARRPALTLRVNAVRLAVMLVTIFPLVHRWGMEGAALSVLLASFTAAALSVVHARGLLRVSPNQ